MHQPVSHQHHGALRFLMLWTLRKMLPSSIEVIPSRTGMQPKCWRQLSCIESRGTRKVTPRNHPRLAEGAGSQAADGGRGLPKSGVPGNV